MGAHAQRVFALLALAVTAGALVMDQEATNDIITATNSGRDEGEVALVFRGPQGTDSRREELVHAKASDDIAFWLYYNKKSNKATLEILHGGHMKSVSWGLADHPRTSMVLIASPKRVKLMVGCKQLHWHALAGKFDLIDILSRDRLKLYHEENAEVKVYGTEKAASDYLSCNDQQYSIKPPSLISVDEGNEENNSDVVEVKDFLKNEERWKREEEMQGDQYRDNFIPNDPRTSTAPPRGDIPSNVIESCDDEVVRQLTLLRQTIDSLRREIAQQQGTIEDLRKRLGQCCNRPQQPPVERCSGSTCYPGY